MNERTGGVFSSIEEALHDNSLQSGDIIIAGPGTYEPLNYDGLLPNNITIKASAAGSAHIPYISLSGSTFNGLTIEGFSFMGTSALPGDAQLSVLSSGNYQGLQVKNNIFDGKQSAVRAIATTQPIVNLTIDNNQLFGFRERTSEPYLYSVIMASSASSTTNRFTARNNSLADSTLPSFIESFGYRNVLIDANSVDAQAGQILVWSGQSAILESVIISNNTINTVGDYGLAIFGNTETLNSIIGNQVSGQTVCIIAPLVQKISIERNDLSNCKSLGIMLSSSLPGFFDTELLEASIMHNTMTNSPGGISSSNQLYISGCVNTFNSVDTHFLGNVDCLDTVGPTFTNATFKNQYNEQIITASPGQLITIEIEIDDPSTVISPTVQLLAPGGIDITSQLTLTAEANIYSAHFTAPTISNQSTSDKSVVTLAFTLTATDFVGNTGTSQASLPLFSFIEPLDSNPNQTEGQNARGTSSDDTGLQQPTSSRTTSPIENTNTSTNSESSEVLAAQDSRNPDFSDSDVRGYNSSTADDEKTRSCTNAFGVCKNLLLGFVGLASLIGLVVAVARRGSTN